MSDSNTSYFQLQHLHVFRLHSQSRNSEFEDDEGESVGVEDASIAVEVMGFIMYFR